MSALILFDIDGTLLRRAGPHHREALEEAARRAVGIKVSTEGVPVAGMLDRDILATMLRREGVSAAEVRRKMPEMMASAQSIYVRRCPDLRKKVCPGARMLLSRLHRRGIPTGLVTGNLSCIAWRKMERSGLKPYLRFGAFAELAASRAGLIRLAVRKARKEGWIEKVAMVAHIGDHPNDILAAKANGIRSVAVATGLVSADELATHKPDILVSDMRSLSLEMLLA